MVTFGTNQGPIEPKEPRPKSQQAEPKSLNVRDPAPVSEEQEDIPNPNIYRPPVPHQYRSKLYSYKPPANLVLGTPLDQKYTSSLEKLNYYNRKQFARSFGLDYTGPHAFDKQAYEYLERKPTTLQLALKYNKPYYSEQIEKRLDAPQGNRGEYVNGKFVPQIGIIYSSGVRYYVPQFVQPAQLTNNVAENNPEDENSVYDNYDEKYYNQKKYNNRQ